MYALCFNKITSSACIKVFRLVFHLPMPTNTLHFLSLTESADNIYTSTVVLDYITGIRQDCPITFYLCIVALNILAI